MIGEWNERSARELIDQLVLQGVDYFCLAPGFRCTPLALAVAEHQRAKLTVHFDERGVGFHALGYAKARAKPACVIVTSGTALGNLYPAVMEASLSNLPMVLLTSDRPAELRDVKANQACDQVKFFGSYVRFAVDLPAPHPHLPSRFLATTVAQAVYRSKEGPVQINCPFPEPFFAKETAINEEKTPCIYDAAEAVATPASLEKWAARLSGVQKGVIVVGSHRSTYPFKPLLELAKRLEWPILSDITSGLRSIGSHDEIIRYWDFLLSEKADLVLKLGDQCVSKKLPEWIDAPIMHVSSYAERSDPKHQVTERLICDPFRFCADILPYIKKREGWLKQWKEKEARVSAFVSDFFKTEEQLSEPGIFHALPQTALFIANSMPIRDANWFFFPENARGPVFASRGLSGIDGNIATCSGISSTQPLIGIIGDQTALHDINSLALLKKSPHPATLLIINNGGGGIFSFVSIPQKEKIAEEVFAAAHSLSFQKAAELFELTYTRVQRADELAPLWGKTQIIEVATTRRENVALHRTLNQEIASCLSSCTVS